MKHLSALDALFLHLETPETPMHVGSLMLLEPPTGKKGVYRSFREHIAKRLHLAPVFSRRLAFMPFDLANPVWVHVDDVDLDYHIQHLKLLKPGTQAQLEAAVARLHEGELDRDKPLWQFTVIEGLASGEIGFYAKIHHAALDGQGGIAVAQALLDAERRPARRAGKGEAESGHMPPTAARMIGAALRNTVAQYGKIVMALPDAVKAAGRVGAVALMASQAKKLGAPTEQGTAAALKPPAKMPKGLTLGPRTSLNTAIGGKRGFVAVQIPLDEAKQIARHFGVKLNDVVLAACAGALRREFEGDAGALSKAMIGAVPASLRAPGDTTAANYVTMMLVSLATHIADPLKRLAAIHAASNRAKMLTGSMKSAIPTDMPSLGVPWLMAAGAALYRKAAEARRIPVIANVIVSNVPGPQVSLYMAGLEMRAYYPVSIVTHGLALNITIISYNGSLDFGLVADRKAMPNLRRFARYLQASHQELLQMARSR